MPWYYVENGEQRGPVTDADFDSLTQAGKVTDDTLVWREGQPSWQPWRDAKPKPAAAVATPGGGLICAECGKAFQPEQVIRLNDRWVCATCKPVYLQRLREGATFGGATATAATTTEAQVRERDYEHDVGQYLSQAWEMFKSDPGSLILAVFLVKLCIFIAGIVPFPYGFAISLIITGPLLGGLFHFGIKKVRNQPATISDAFSGFQRFAQLLLGYFFPTILSFMCLLPAAFTAVAMGLTVAMLRHSGNQSGNIGEVLTPVFFAAVGGIGLAGLIAAIFLQVSWMFTQWLIVDKNLTFWPAMSLSWTVVNKHWWQTFLLAIVTGVLSVICLCTCFIGGLITGPIKLVFIGRAYERLFGDMKRAD